MTNDLLMLPAVVSETSISICAFPYLIVVREHSFAV